MRCPRCNALIVFSYYDEQAYQRIPYCMCGHQFYAPVPVSLLPRNHRLKENLAMCLGDGNWHGLIDVIDDLRLRFGYTRDSIAAAARELGVEQRKEGTRIKAWRLRKEECLL